MGDAIVIVVVVVLMALSAIGSWLAVRRRGEMGAVARRNGLEFSEADPFDCSRVAFPLFRLGDGRRTANVMWREGERGPVRGFDFEYYVEGQTADGQSTKRYRHHSCVLAFVNSSWPDITIEREGIVDRVVDSIGGTDIDLESEEFNRTFTLRCADRRFATTLLAPQLMEVLLSTKGRLSFAIKGRWLLIHTSRVKPALVPAIMRVAEAFVHHIPPVVWELYPTPFVDDDGKPLPAGDEDLDLHRSLHVPRDAEALSGTSPYAPLFDALDADGVEYDLDGKPLPARKENPWGEGQS